MIEFGKMEIIQSGPLCLIQDLGRLGFQNVGYSTSGAADEHSFLWANKLVGNNTALASLEITYGPFISIFDQKTKIALCGAKAEAKINDTPISLWASHDIFPGDILRISSTSSGIKLYLGIKDGIQVEPVYKSQSMSYREKIGFNFGQPLTKGSIISFLSENALKLYQKATPPRFIPDYNERLLLRIIPGYQYEDFSEDIRSKICSSDYTITNQINRMGYCLDGTPLNHQIKELSSEGTAFGAIQVPPTGQPIILLKERQTIGGYPKLGCVSHIDCFALSQRRPGQKVRFAFTNVKSAAQELKNFYRFFLKK